MHSFKFLNFFGTTFNNEKNITFHSIIVKSGDTACLYGGTYAHYYGSLYEELSNLTGYGEPGGAVIGSVCDQDYTNELQNIGQSVVDMQKTVSLECMPLDADADGEIDMQVTYQAMGTNGYVAYNAPYVIQGQKLIFDQFLPAGDFRFDYKCNQ